MLDVNFLRFSDSAARLSVRGSVSQSCNRESIDQVEAADYHLRGSLLVPNTNMPLPIRCPKCHHKGSMLLVRSLTVMTLTCAECGHTWATDMNSLPPDVQARVPDALDRLMR